MKPAGIKCDGPHVCSARETRASQVPYLKWQIYVTIV